MSFDLQCTTIDSFGESELKSFATQNNESFLFNILNISSDTEKILFIQEYLSSLNYNNISIRNKLVVVALFKWLWDIKINLPIWMRFFPEFSDIYFHFCEWVNWEYLNDLEVISLFKISGFEIYKSLHISIALNLFCNNWDIDFFEWILDYLLISDILEWSKDYIINILEDVKQQVADNNLIDKINNCLSKYWVDFAYNDMINWILEDINVFAINSKNEKKLSPNIVKTKVNVYLDALFEWLELADVYEVFKLFIINFEYFPNAKENNELCVNWIYDYFLSEYNLSFLLEHSINTWDINFLIMLRYKLVDWVYLFTDSTLALWNNYSQNIEVVLSKNIEELVKILTLNIRFYLNILAVLYDLRLVNIIRLLVWKVRFKLSDINEYISLNPRNQKKYIKFSKWYCISWEERVSSSDFWILVPNYNAIREYSDLFVKFNKNDNFSDAYFFSIYFDNKNKDSQSADIYEYDIVKWYNFWKTFAKWLETELSWKKVFCPFSFLPQDIKPFVYLLKKPTTEVLKKYRIKLFPQRGRDDIFVFETKE